MNSDYELIYRKDAVKFLAKQEVSIQIRIAKGLAGLISIPPTGDIKHIKGQQSLYRLRIGAFRILFEVNHSEKIVYVQAIDSRGGIYK
ncbi:type II toxin-antitoxin system RelE family toxin [Desulfosporosinus hippei]|uniref:mRNA-degrading endonuclease RelE, toxin component of the RelBE toxin-antitoxin system n=1 Tax=Desulfosporosinus hippei DSM 8344 TaxID=1121419 RepID=A0A1G7SD91_9FIRM|nr:type II toxin-antitoxin system RelE/ParE family toxin [Desulfosporosinus hippei]SDG21016.1 mRNA-degrading endonuclease RelE, toxin component of the RelBE toxin-antitoxin system [Desulfosporosinus hippei DSM 8344]